MHPILFKLGPVTIYSYGLFVALGFAAASLLIIRESPKYGIRKELLWDLLFYALISGLAGARLLHVLLNLKFYLGAPLEILMIHRGGLAIQGGIIFALFTCVPYAVKKRIPVPKALDLIFLYLPLGHSIGRIGCYLNGCCFGRWEIPTQLYSSLGLLAVFIMLRIISIRKRFDGQIFLFYFLMDAPLRFFIDFFRGDLDKALFGLTASQLISVATFIAALSVYHYAKIHAKSRREE